MEPEALLGLLAQTTVARLLERDDFQKRLAAGAADRRAGAALSRCCRATTRSRSRPTSSWAGPTRSSTCSSAATSRPPTAQAPQSILTMPILVGTDGVQKMSKSLGNYVGVTDAAGGDVRPADEHPRRGDGRVLPAAARRRAARAGPPNEAKRELGRRIVDRFHGDGAGAAAEAALQPGASSPTAVPDDVAEVGIDPYVGSDGRRDPPAAADRRRFRGQLQRGTAPDRPGRRQARRRDGRRGQPTIWRRKRLTGGFSRSASGASAAFARGRTRQTSAAALYSPVLLGLPCAAPCVKSVETRRRGAAVFEN